MKIEIHSDIACPWCYVGVRRFEQALAAFSHAESVDVIYRPYQLDPTESEQPSPLFEMLIKKYGELPAHTMRNQIVEIGKREGIDFQIERALVVNTLLSHRLLWLAEQEYGNKIQAKLNDLLFRAYFTEGGNVGDRNLLADLAAQAGMDRDRVIAFLASDEEADEVHDAIRMARAMGITAVPTFIFDGKQRVQGAQDMSTFLQVLEQIDKGTSKDAINAKSNETDSCCIA